MDLRKIASNDERKHRHLYSGYLRRLSPAFGIYKPDYDALSFNDRERLRLLAHSLGLTSSILVLNSAARWHGLWVIGDDAIEATTRNGKLPLRNRWYGRRYYSILLRREHWGQYFGVRCTNPARTCIDIARIHGFRAGLVAMDSFLALGHNVHKLRSTLSNVGRLKGIATARRCLNLAISNSGSPWESVVRADLLDCGIAMEVEAQKKILNYYADICIDGWLVVEVDGNVKYDGTFGDPTSAIVDERRREKEITNAGYRVLRLSPQQLASPDALIEMVRRELSFGPLRRRPAV